MRTAIFGAGSDLGVHIDGASLGPEQLINDITPFYKGEIFPFKPDPEIIKSRNISDRRKNNMEMNGQFVINNNPLAHSINYGRKNTVNGLDNNIRSKMGKIKQENLIKRQYTHKVKHNAHKNEINKLDINF